MPPGSERETGLIKGAVDRRDNPTSVVEEEVASPDRVITNKNTHHPFRSVLGGRIEHVGLAAEGTEMGEIREGTSANLIRGPKGKSRVR